jgi:hypothetical protein
MLKGNTSYDIIYSPDLGEYDKYLQAVQEMINSFEITNNNQSVVGIHLGRKISIVIWRCSLD